MRISDWSSDVCSFDLDFQLDLGVRIERGQVVEVDAVAGVLGRIEIDLADLEESEVALAVLGRADLPLHRVAGAQAEAAYLAGAHIDVVRSGAKVRFRRAQEPEAVLQYLQHAAAVDRLVVS